MKGSVGSFLKRTPTNLFTVFELQNQSHDVPELHKIRKSPNHEALKMLQSSSGCASVRVSGRKIFGKSDTKKLECGRCFWKWRKESMRKKKHTFFIGKKRACNSNSSFVIASGCVWVWFLQIPFPFLQYMAVLMLFSFFVGLFTFRTSFLFWTG